MLDTINQISDEVPENISSKWDSDFGSESSSDGVIPVDYRKVTQKIVRLRVPMIPIIIAMVLASFHEERL